MHFSGSVPIKNVFGRWWELWCWLFCSFFAAQQHERQQAEAWSQLGAVQSSLIQNQFDAAKKSLADWQSRYGASSASSYANFLKGDLLAKTADHVGAAQVYAQLAATARPEILQPLALSAEISEEEMAGKIPEARATAQRFIDKYPDHFSRRQRIYHKPVWPN